MTKNSTAASPLKYFPNRIFCTSGSPCDCEQIVMIDSEMCRKTFMEMQEKKL